MGTQRVVIGTRASTLALWQANYIKELIEQAEPTWQVIVKKITTKGDQIRDVPLPEIGGKGIFTEAIERELLQGEIQIAVHSLKDLPGKLPSGLIYAGSPQRATPCDAFISHKWPSLNAVADGGIVATGSTRRRALMQSIRPTLRFTDLRGNIETRLKKLRDNDWDGIILSAAALERLGKQQLITEYLNPEQFVPAVGQGAIGVEINQEREDILELIQRISDKDTMDAVIAERAFLKRLEGGCSVPLGAWASLQEDKLCLTGFVASPEGGKEIRHSITKERKQAKQAGEELAEIFIRSGAKELL